MKNKISKTKSSNCQHILITGGAGFIGSNLSLKLLEKGYKITILDNLSPQIHGKNAVLNPKLKGRVNFIHADVRNLAALKRGIKNVEVIIHLAAETGMGQSQYEISKYVSVNIQAQAELFQLLINKPHQVKKIIIASSSRIYGEGMYQCTLDGIVYPLGRSKSQLEQGQWEMNCPICGKNIIPLPNKENALPLPSSIYAVSKLTQEHLALVFGNAYKIPIVILRYQNIYGPGQALNNPYTGIISIFSSRILNDKSPVLYEDGNPTRDFIYIEDVVQATILALESPLSNNRIINVGSGQVITIKKMANQLLKALGSNLHPQISEEFRMGDIRHSCADISLAKKLLGYAPHYLLEKGLVKYAAWLKQQQKVVDQSKKAADKLARLNLLGKKLSK